jgi:hypothetical protein
MVQLQVPSARYAIFEHRGAVKNIDHTVSYIYGTWLMQSGHRHTYGPDLELYGAHYHPTREDSVIHYAIPVTYSKQGHSTKRRAIALQVALVTVRQMNTFGLYVVHNRQHRRNFFAT